MNIGIPRVFGVAVDSISVCLKLEIASGVLMGTRCSIMSPLAGRELLAAVLLLPAIVPDD
jgi:hypothetical protein